MHKKEGFFLVEIVVYCTFVIVIGHILFQTVMALSTKLQQRTTTLQHLGSLQAAFALFARDIHASSASIKTWNQDIHEMSWQIRGNTITWRYKKGSLYRITSSYDPETTIKTKSKKSIVAQGIKDCLFTCDCDATKIRTITVSAKIPVGNQLRTFEQTVAPYGMTI